MIRPILSWLLSSVSDHVFDAAIRKAFDKDVLQKCHARADEWKESLPDEAKLISVDMFFQPESSHGISELPPKPESMLSAIKLGRVPTQAEWLEDLMRQWEWVRDHVDEPQLFFQVDGAAATQHLDELARLLSAESACNAELFRTDVYETTHAIQRDVRELNRKVESFVAQSDFRRDSLVAEDVGVGDSAFHAEIEAAVAHTKNGQPLLCIAALDNLEKRHWNKLSPHERYRLQANRGIALSEAGESDKSAREFIACVQHEPNEEKPRCFEANGFFMLGDREKCASLAREILIDYPESTFAYALRVYSSPLEAALSEIENLVPKHYRDVSEVAMALSERSEALGLVEKAEEYARTACEGGDPHPSSIRNLGGIIIESAMLQARPLLSDSPPINEERIREGMKLLEKGIQEFEKRGDKRSAAQCHFHLGRAHHLFGDNVSAERELLAAKTARPGEARYCTQYALAVCDLGREDEAIDLLKEAAEKGEPINAGTLAAQLIYSRTDEGNIQQACEVLESVLPQFPSSVAAHDAQFLYTLVELYNELERQVDALHVASELGKKLGSIEQLTISALSHRLAGDSIAAESDISEAKKLVTSDTEPWTRHLVALELQALEMHEEVFLLLSKYVPDNCRSIDTLDLVNCALRCEQHGFLITFLGNLRKAGILEPSFINVELDLLERYHAGIECIEIIQSLLDQVVSNHELCCELRVRLSFLGLLYNQSALIEDDLERLPRADVAAAYVGSLVVQLLVRLERFEEAREYAYNLLRCNVDSADAHKALIGSYLFEECESAPPDPGFVAPGTAFCYIEDGVAGDKFAVIEDGGSPDISQDEYPASHHMIGNALGKQVGERFMLRDDGIQQIAGTIKSIQDKKVFRFNRCIHDYDRRFDDGFLVQVRIPKDSQGQLDLTPIRKAAKERSDSINRRDEVYRSYPMSVAGYATFSQASFVDVVGHLANESMPIRCSVGSHEEEQAGIQLLESSPRIVIDPSAVATLVHTDACHLLDILPFELVIPKGLILRMRVDIEQGIRGRGALSYVDSELVFHEVSQEQKERWAERLDSTIVALESKCSIVDGLPLANIEPSTRNELIGCFGWDVAESIGIASNLRAGLWTDDLFVAMVARELVQVGRVWTELVTQRIFGLGKLEQDRYFEIISQLVKLGYCHTKLLPEIAIKMANDADWDFRREPLKSVIGWLSKAGISSAGICGLAETLLPLVYGHQGEMLDNMTVLKILGSIGERRDGRQIVKQLRRRVGFYCGMDYVTEQRLSQDLDKWLEFN